MSKIIPYQIYHLDHQKLIQLERGLGRGNIDEASQEAAAVAAYKSLMSNRPRYDPTIREYFGSRERTLEEAIEDQKRDVEKMEDEKLQRKIKSCGELLELGFYKKVADVDADTAQLAIDATTSINSRWFVVHTKKVIPTAHACRSTESYDLIQRFDEWFLKMPLGFVDVQEQDYATKLV